MLTTKLPINLKAYREHCHQQCLHFFPSDLIKGRRSYYDIIHWFVKSCFNSFPHKDEI